MIATDRVLGGCVMLFGAVLLVYLIPEFVAGEAIEGSDPKMFPSIAAWLFILLGGLQVVFPGGNTSLPPLREISRSLLFVGAMVVGTILMPLVGFIPYAIGLMTVTILLVYEKRPVWVGLTVVAVPIGTWALFEIVLNRPLP